MPRRRRLPPDTRPDWRDPDMPCLVISKSEGQIYIAPERLDKVAKFRLDNASEPHFTCDPTYNLRKPK